MYTQTWLPKSQVTLAEKVRRGWTLTGNEAQRAPRLGAYIPGNYPLPAGGPLIRPRGLGVYIRGGYPLPTVSGRIATLGFLPGELPTAMRNPYPNEAEAVYAASYPVDVSSLPAYGATTQQALIRAANAAGVSFGPTTIVAPPVVEGITEKLNRWLQEDIAGNTGVSKGLALGGAGLLLGVAILSKPSRRY